MAAVLLCRLYCINYWCDFYEIWPCASDEVDSFQDSFPVMFIFVKRDGILRKVRITCARAVMVSG